MFEHDRGNSRSPGSERGEVDLSREVLPRGTTPRFQEFARAQASFSLKRTSVALVTLASLLFGANHIRRNWDELLLSSSSSKLTVPSWFEKGTWPVNTAVLASSLQSMDAYFYYSYSQQLAENIRNPKHRNLQAAHRDLETGLRGFFRIQAQLPTSSLKRVQGWNKSEEAERHVFLITGQKIETDSRNLLSGDEAAIFRRNAESLASALKDEYGVPESNLRRLHQGTVPELERLIKTLEDLPANAEALIYINAHGTSLPNENLPKELREAQGANDGYLWLAENEAFTEEDFQKLLSEHGSHLKSIVLVIDACESGAWTAVRESKVAPQKSLGEN